MKNSNELPIITVTTGGEKEEAYIAYTFINGERADIYTICKVLKEYTDAANNKIKELENKISELESRISNIEGFHTTY